MFDTKFKTKKVVVDGQNKIIPLQKKTIFGFGFWTKCKEWQEVETQLTDERLLGLNSDSTVTHIRKFIDKRDPNPRNEFYND